MMPITPVWRRYVDGDGFTRRAKRIGPDVWIVEAAVGEEGIPIHPVEPVQLDNAAFRDAFTRESLAEIALLPIGPSSNLMRAGYDPATWDLLVEFKGGAVYHYRDVDPRIAAPLLTLHEPGAKFSLGGYFQKAIKAHAVRYPYRRLGADDGFA